VGQAMPVVRQYRIHSVLDFGAGVGTDALQFAASGLQTWVSELNEAAAQFLLWRAKHRNLVIRRVDAEQIDNKRAYELIWAIDVIEHLWNPCEALRDYVTSGRLLVYDTEHKGKSGGRQPFHFPYSQSKLDRDWRQLGLRFDAESSQKTKMRVFSNRYVLPIE
jgi:hypothetical protein